MQKGFDWYLIAIGLGILVFIGVLFVAGSSSGVEVVLEWSDEVTFERDIISTGILGTLSVSNNVFLSKRATVIEYRACIYDKTGIPYTEYGYHVFLKGGEVKASEIEYDKRYVEVPKYSTEEYTIHIDTPAYPFKDPLSENVTSLSEIRIFVLNEQEYYGYDYCSDPTAYSQEIAVMEII